MSAEDIVIDARRLSKRYEIYATPRERLKQLVLPRMHRTAAALGLPVGHAQPCYYREFWALRDTSFELRQGETLGLIGRNGSGKSTLLQILAGTLTPTAGEVTVKGRVAALLELGSGFNPEFTGRENVFMNGHILGLSRQEIEARYADIAEFADIGAFIDEPVKTYSSGMFLRLAFAVQAHIDASIVIIDEALAVGDVFFRQKCFNRLEQLRASGTAILLVSHSMPEILQYCARAILLDRGEPRFVGSASEAIKHYFLLHQGARGVAPPAVPASTDETLAVAGARVIARPKPESLLDLTGKAQVGNGQAKCTAIALSDAAGEPCNAFRQGDTAVFHYEFELSEPIEVPVCGMVMLNDRGVIVHGKNSWQYDDDVPVTFGPGSKVSCRHEVQLNLGPGEYTFEVGLVSVAAADWQRREQLSHEEATSRSIRVCHVPQAGFFSVGLAMKNGVAVLTHHGIADLPGSMTISAVPADSVMHDAANAQRVREPEQS